MVAVLENPAVRARVEPCSVERYHQLAELGMLSERTELIRGAIIEKMSQSPSPASTVEIIRVHLEKSLPPNHFVRQEKPLTLVDSEPEPDLAVIHGRRSEFLKAHPNTAMLVVEVAVSSEALDRLKLEIYAEAGVPECWLVFPETQSLERHTKLMDGAYRNIQRAAFPARLESTVFPEVHLPPPDLFGS
jgi:Uma2 family endonuclease